MSGRIEQIFALIKERGPMTVEQLAAAMGISETTTGEYINLFRKHEKGLRVVDYDRGCPTRKARIYGLGTEPDAIYPAQGRRPPSKEKRIKYPGMTREEFADWKRRKEAMQQIKPFRDPMIFATAGISI